MPVFSTTSRSLLGAAVLGLAVLGGCANQTPRSSVPPPYSGGSPYGNGQATQSGVQYGHVEAIELIKAENQTSGAGAVIGGVLGAVVGNQIGKGSGRAAATGIGAIGGVIAGNQIEKGRGTARDFVRISVRLDQGGTRQFDYEPGVDIRQGDRVYVQGDQLMRY